MADTEIGKIVTIALKLGQNVRENGQNLSFLTNTRANLPKRNGNNEAIFGRTLSSVILLLSKLGSLSNLLYAWTSYIGASLWNGLLGSLVLFVRAIAEMRKFGTAYPKLVQPRPNIPDMPVLSHMLFSELAKNVFRRLHERAKTTIDEVRRREG